tara:strand:- start:937 stop:1269 length:333 start_codon:yes stop_codon:yes gene_type:complete
MIKILPVLLLLSGCIALKKNMVDYNPTNSMCLDSLVVNMQAEGCDVISIDKYLYGVNKITCKEHGEANAETSWLTKEFYTVAYGSTMPPNVIPICTDPFLLLTTVISDEE